MPCHTCIYVLSVNVERFFRFQFFICHWSSRPFARSLVRFTPAMRSCECNASFSILSFYRIVSVTFYNAPTNLCVYKIPGDEMGFYPRRFALFCASIALSLCAFFAIWTNSVCFPSFVLNLSGRCWNVNEKNNKKEKTASSKLGIHLLKNTFK